MKGEIKMQNKMVNVIDRLKAPKSQYNSFGGYNYRSCEDILNAVKPLLSENGLLMSITDDVVQLGTRYYVKATVTVTDGTASMSVSAFAREADTKKGMDESQITGAASSYARKYALNGMFDIDDTKDADSTNDHGKKPEKTEPKAKKMELATDEQRAHIQDMVDAYGDKWPDATTAWIKTALKADALTKSTADKIIEKMKGLVKE